MAADFPAAHSMDTTWFAADCAGHVAAFNSGEDGHVPLGVDEERAHYLRWLFRSRHPQVPVWEHPPDEAMAEEFGFFHFAYGGPIYPIGLYDRRVVPPRPVHVDQLPPEVRKGCKRLRVPVPVAQLEHLQPLDFFACEFWDAERAGAYLTADGVTVRPLPGRDAQFPEFVRYMRETWPDQATRYRFEGVDDGP